MSFTRLGVAIFICGSLFVHHIHGQAGGCGAPNNLQGLAYDPKVYRERSSALQIFSEGAITCAGRVVSFNFISKTDVVNALHFSIWRPDPSNAYKFTLVGEAPVNNYAASRDTWNSFTTFNPIPVQVGDVVGIFYDNWITEQVKVPVPHSDRFSALPGESSQLTYFRTFISLVGAPEIYGAAGAVAFQSAAKDLRLPAVQAIVSTDPGVVTGAPVTFTPPYSETPYTQAPFTNPAFTTTPEPSTGGATRPPRCFAKPVRDVDFNNCAGAKTTRYYYNSQTAQCVGFLGCDNINVASNNFALKPVCQQVCQASGGATPAPATPAPQPTPAPSTDRCALKPIRGVDFGTCGTVSAANRYYYNPTTKACVAFQGCANPSGNNFETKNDCTLRCTGATAAPPLPPATAAPTLPPATRMTTAAPAPSSARCALKPVRGVDFGTCPSGAATIVRYYYNVNTVTCIGFQGCVNPQGNNFATSSECTTACIGGFAVTLAPAPTTTTKAVTGRCTANPMRGVDFGTCPGDNTKIRYYWSKGTSTCVGFQGCINNNGNNWASKEDCQAGCATNAAPMSAPMVPPPQLAPSTLPDRCKMNPARDTDFGNCAGDKSVRWYYTQNSKSCIAFNGCSRPDRNNFPSRTACGLICNGVDESVRAARCRSNPATGLYDCDETKRVANRTWFDVSTRACTTFKYNVCPLDSGNNFDSIEDCGVFCNSLIAAS